MENKKVTFVNTKLPFSCLSTFRDAAYTCLEIRGNRGFADTQLDCCSVYWSGKGKYPLQDLRSVSEIWDNSGQKPSIHDLIYSH